MAKSKRTLDASTFDNFDETDLDLDLDDDQILSSIDTSKYSSNKDTDKDNNKKDETKKSNNAEIDDDGFKKPIGIPSSITPDQSLDEDEEDLLIRTQPMFSSTQVFSSQSQKISEPSNLSILEDSIFESQNNEPEVEKSITCVFAKPASSSSDRTFPKPVSTVIKTEKFIDKNKIDEEKCWRHTIQHLNKSCSIFNSQNGFLKKYTIDFYLKKFFEYDLLVKASDSSIRKLPILVVWIKEITRKSVNTTAAVSLTDGTEQIKGTLSKNIAKDFWDNLAIGSVLVLQDVPVLRINYKKNSYHLNINQNNILKIYSGNLDDSLETYSVTEISFKPIDIDQIHDFVLNFETNFVNFENSLVDTSNNNKSTVSNTSTTKQKPSSKAAPYQVPQQFKNNPPQNRQEKPSLQPQQTKKPQNVPRLIPQNQPNKSLTTISISTDANSVKPTNQANTSTVRKFNFGSQKPKPAEQSHNKTVTNDQLSQLLSGIDDKIFDEDDENNNNNNSNKNSKTTTTDNQDDYDEDDLLMNSVLDY